jgi:hypothetical protein
MRKNIAERGRTHDNIVCRMRSACWISKATNSIKMCNNYCRYTTVVRRTRLSITLYVHCLSCSFPVSLINPHSGSRCPLNRAPTHEAECQRQINETCQIKQRRPYKFVSADIVILLLLFYYNPSNAELNPICQLLVLLGDLTFMVPCIVSIFRYTCISNKMERYTVFISGYCSTCFGLYFHPLSGVHTTVSTASGICHTVKAICRYRGRVGTGLSVLWVAYATHSTLKPVPTRLR